MSFSIKDVTYLSILPNLLSNKENSDIDSIIRLANCELSDLDFFEKKVFTCELPKQNSGSVKVQKIETIDYDKFTEVASRYGELFDSEFMLNFHCDAFILNPSSWTDDFLNYDYIGALFDAGGSREPCSGNGGFSIRSKKFCELFKYFYTQLPEDYKKLPEDFLCCHVLRKSFEDNGIKFAPQDICSKFSTEHLALHQEDFYNSFGIHEFKPLSKEEAVFREINVDFNFMCDNPKDVEMHRLKIYNKIFK